MRRAFDVIVVFPPFHSETEVALDLRIANCLLIWNGTGDRLTSRRSHVRDTESYEYIPLS